MGENSDEAVFLTRVMGSVGVCVYVYTCVGVLEAQKKWRHRRVAFQTSDGPKQSKASVGKLCNPSLPNRNNGHSGWSNPSKQPMYTSLSSEILKDPGTSVRGLNSLNARTNLVPP